MNIDSIRKTSLTDRQAAVYFLGQEGVLLLHGGCTLVIDPYLTDYVDRNCCSPAVQWKRLYPAPMAPEDLAGVNYVLCTHEHYDHADPDTLSRLAAVSPETRFIVPAPVHAAVASYGIPEERIIDAEADQPISCGAFRVIPVPAAHEEFHQDELGRYRELGYRVEFGGMKIFHAGDCCIYDGLEKRVTDMDVVFLPINGRSIFKNRVDIIGNMTTEEAIELAIRTGAKMMVPLHHDLYAVNGVNPAIFVDMINSACPTLPYHIFKPGERYLLCSE